MALFRKLILKTCELNIKNCSRISISSRNYSVFGPNFVKPVFRPEEQERLAESEELSEIFHAPILPAFTNETSSEFYDPVVQKFINFLTKEGNKLRARNILENTFEIIKRIQIERYHKAKTPEDKDKIELDPKIVLRKAIENSTPVLELLKIKKGGQVYQVPVPLTEKRAAFLGITWLIEAGKNKDPNVRIWQKLAEELIEASQNQGRVIKKKQELYRQCEANRSYAHFRWF